MAEKDNQKVNARSPKETAVTGDALKEKARADSYLNLIGGIVVALDKKGKVTLINRGGEKMLGYTSEELVGKDWFEQCIPQRKRNDVREVFSKMLSGETQPVEFFENEVVTRDGKELLVAWHNIIVRDDDGIVGTISSGLDISEHRQAELLLRNRANVMKAFNVIVTVCNEATSFNDLVYSVLESVIDLLYLDGGGIYLIDEPSKSGTLVCYHGLPTDFIETFKLANLEDGQNKVLLDRVPIFLEHAVEANPSMAQRWGFQSMAAIPLVSKGRLVGALNIASKTRAVFTHEEREILSLISKDVGMALDRTMAEANLKTSEENYKEAYELANFYKDLFAHDMNNILQSIISVAEMHELYKDQPEKLDKLEAITGTIKFHARRGAKLVSEVRKISMLDEEDAILVATDLDGVIADSVKSVSKGHATKRITASVTGLKGEKVLANDLLVDVFDNLLDNAVKYTDGEVVAIDVKVSRVATDEVPRVRIEFDDRGIGIPDDVKSTLFEKAIRKGSSQRGMGMGLSLIKKILNKYGGTIRVEDRVSGDYSQGCKFVVLLPPAL